MSGLLCFMAFSLTIAAVLDPNQIAATISETASGEAVKSCDRLTAKTDAVAKMRLEFFDRIVLLDAGTVALSLTLLGFLAPKVYEPTAALKKAIRDWSAFRFSLVSKLAAKDSFLILIHSVGKIYQPLIIFF